MKHTPHATKSPRLARVEKLVALACAVARTISDDDLDELDAHREAHVEHCASCAALNLHVAHNAFRAFRGEVERMSNPDTAQEHREDVLVEVLTTALGEAVIAKCQRMGIDPRALGGVGFPVSIDLPPDPPQS